MSAGSSGTEHQPGGTPNASTNRAYRLGSPGLSVPGPSAQRASPRAVFFDSGGTLARPLRDEGWPKPRFAELIAAAGLPVPDDDAAGAALKAGTAYLAERWRLTTLDEELAAYRGFYEIVLHTLYDDAPAPLVHDLAEAAVYDLDQEPFDDTVPVLDRLRDAGVRLAVITNAGPSIELRHRDMGLRDYFDPFVISAVVGHEKPGAPIYRIALEHAGLAPADAVFVDDVAENVRAALEVGMDAYLIDHSLTDHGGAPPTSSDLTALPSLTALLPMIINGETPHGVANR